MLERRLDEGAAWGGHDPVSECPSLSSGSTSGFLLNVLGLGDREPDEIQPGRNPDGPHGPGNALQCWEPFTQHHKIQTVEWQFEQSEQGKVFSRRNIFFICERVHTCNKSVFISGNATDMEKKTFHKNFYLKPQQMHTREKL